ncbi:MAG TPA: FtsX-like permease family protein [Bacteroidota bacterium]
MSFERTIALRYLASKKQFGFVTAISFISIVGVSIGVAALIVVLSVFNGFNGLVTSILVSFDPHLRIESPQRVELTAYEPLMSYLDSEPEVAGSSPYVLGKAMLVARNIMRVVNVKGIEDGTIGSVSGLRDNIVLGSLDFQGERQNGIVLGLALSDRLGAIVGDTITVVSPVGSELALLQLGQPFIRRFQVVGIYESNNKEYDGNYAYVGLAAAQTLFKMGNAVHGVELRFSSVDEADRFKSKLVQKFGSEYRILTWYDLHRELYSVMQIERWMAYIILCLIIGVASFNLLGSLTMTVIEKTRDIGILKSMGTEQTKIRRIFAFQGIFVGIVGSVVGLVLGLLLVILQQRYHLFPLDPTVYIIPAIPTEIQVVDIMLVVLTAIFLCSVAALYPARRAASLIPAEAIRWE